MVLKDNKYGRLPSVPHLKGNEYGNTSNKTRIHH